MSLYAISTGGAGDRLDAAAGGPGANRAKVIDQAFLDAVLADGPPHSAWGQGTLPEIRHAAMMMLVFRIREVVQKLGAEVGAGRG